MAWIDIPYTHITFGVFVGSPQARRSTSRRPTC